MSTFTIKYIYPNGIENITTGWESVSAEFVDVQGNNVDQTGPVPVSTYRVVHVHGKNDEHMQFGPVIPHPDDLAPRSYGYVYVMNDNGATVAKYTL